jgi:hypothetical protein
MQADRDASEQSPQEMGIRLFTYQDAVLHCSTGGIIAQGRFMPPAAGPRFDYDAAAIDAIVAAAEQSPKIPEPLAVAHRPGWNNYYHWTTQCLLNIHLIHQAGVLDWARLALLPLSPVQQRSLELLGIDLANAIYVDRDVPIRAKSLTASDLQFSRAIKRSVADIRRMGLLIRSRVAAQTATYPAIYLSRLDSKRRKMTNEEALIRKLERLGIRPVQMSGKTLDEQIAVIAGARLIVAPHGAGLTNIIYSSSGAQLYELFPSYQLVPCYQQLAEASGVGYSSAVFDVPASRSNDRKKNYRWAVDIDMVARHAEQLLEENPAPDRGLIRPKRGLFGGLAQAIANVPRRLLSRATRFGLPGRNASG